MALPPVFIAHTHRGWFDHLSTFAKREYEGSSVVRLRLDEANFWSPRSPRPPKNFRPGEPVFLRLGAPTRSLAGFGFFATHHLVSVYTAWDLFGPKNGAPTLAELARMLGRTSARDLQADLSCMILRDLVLWPERRWIRWGPERGYANTGTQKGRTDTENAALLWACLAEARPATLEPQPLTPFVPLDVDERLRRGKDDVVVREGQGTFRLTLLKAYEGQCAVTREHTEPVLQAAHIQPYLGPASNHVQNGLLLTSEFHTLFDRGLVGIEPPRPGRDTYRLRVSGQLRDLWNNGHRYYGFEGQDLVVPRDPDQRPSRQALQWHLDTRFEKGLG